MKFIEHLLMLKNQKKEEKEKDEQLSFVFPQIYIMDGNDICSIPRADSVKDVNAGSR